MIISELLHDTNFWVSLSFFAFAIVAFRAGYGKVISGLDQKIKAIRDELEEAESLRIEAQELLAQYHRKHRDAMKEAEEIIQHAKTHAQNLKLQAASDLKDVMERREKQLQERLERVETSAAQEIKAYAAELSVDTAKDLIYAKLDKKSDAKLIDQAVADLPKNLH